MSSIEHSIRNWLHQVVLSVQAIHVPTLLEAMDECHFEGIFDLDGRPLLTDWEATQAEVEKRLGHLRIGDLSLRVGKTAISMDGAADAMVEWEMGCIVGRNMEQIMPLTCVALINNRSGAWKATRIEVSGVPVIN